MDIIYGIVYCILFCVLELYIVYCILYIVYCIYCSALHNSMYMDSMNPYRLQNTLSQQTPQITSNRQRKRQKHCQTMSVANKQSKRNQTNGPNLVYKTKYVFWRYWPESVRCTGTLFSIDIQFLPTSTTLHSPMAMSSSLAPSLELCRQGDGTPSH